MLLTQKKNQYAIRAIYELAKHLGEGPLKISEIAEAQAIPLRFLEVILGQLKGSGFVVSKRGFYGGYQLTKSPDQITVGDVIRFIQGPMTPVKCVGCETEEDCPFGRECAFSSMWEKVVSAVYGVYDETTIQDLIDNQRMRPPEA